MSTSLAAQLQKLAVPQTALLQRGDKKRASLLFDPKEAATIDRNTFYEIGLSGLRELQDLNADFIVFETSIFSQTSKNVERAVEDKHTNDKLNKTIKRFLMLLSPYFLLKPAHKALEWLIHRFSIHEYNQGDFFKLIFPYHETNVFVRCLQLFNLFSEASPWNWLRNVQKSAIHLNKTTLFNHALSDIGFLKFLSKMVFDAVYENQTNPNSLTILYAFYCTTTIGVIERCRVISEPQLSAILPPLLKGLSSTIPDYVASTYMITAQLLSKVNLSQKLLNSLVQRIASGVKTLRTEATLLLIVLYQSQPDFKTINGKAMKYIAKSDWFSVNVSNFAKSGSYVLPVLIPVLEYSLKHTRYELYQNFIDGVFVEVRVDDETTDVILRTVLDNCPNVDDDSDLSEASSDSEFDTILSTSHEMAWYAALLKKLETQYPASFDKILTETLSCTKNNNFNKHRQALRSIMNFVLIDSSSDGGSRTIFEKLYHPNADNRLHAVEYLVKNFAKLTDKDREIFEGAANVLLLDDDLRIVTAIASMPKHQLLKLLHENNFMEVSVKLLIKCYKKGSSWNRVVLMLLLVICSEERILKNSQILFVLLPFLIPGNDRDLELASRILTSKCSTCYTFLAKAKSSFREGMSVSQFGKNIYDNIVSYNDCPNIDFGNDFKNLPEKLEIHKYLYVLLLASNLKHNKSVLNIEYIQNMTQFLSNSKIVQKKSSSNEVFSFNNALRSNIPPLQGYLKCLQIAIDNIDYDQKLSNQFIDLSSPNETIKVLITILSILLKGCQSENREISSCYTLLMKEFFDRFFPDFQEKINFLSNFINADNSIDSKTQLRIILIIYSLLKQSKQSISWTVDTKSNILVPSILIGLINPLKEIREASILVLQLIANCISTSDKTYKPLLQQLLSTEEEISLDCNQLPLMVGQIFSSVKNKHFIPAFFNLICDPKTPVHISSCLLTVFSFVNSEEILEQVCKYAVTVLKESKNENILLDSHRSSIISNVLLRINDQTCKQISIKSASWDFFSTALRHDIINLNQANGKVANPTVLALDQITREVFANLNPNVQKLLLKTLIEIASTSENPEVVQTIYKTVKKVDLDAKLLIEYLNHMKDLKSVKTLPQRKFRRVSEIPTADILDMIEWRHGITALEFLQDKKKLSNAIALLPVLFGILKKCLDFEEQGAVEYPKQITLSAILHVCNKMEAEGLDLPKTSFNMELIVQCIRASQNPQTHHHALLVLAHTATLIPDQVLHNIMAIFTFMGSSVLRHDDAYSFQIIAKIIDTIIPILVKNCSEEKEKNVAAVLRVFVDVILDVPEHRRMPLFQKLLVTLGTEDYLWLFLVLVFEAHVLHKTVETTKQETKNHRLVTGEKPKRLDIVTNIALEFSPPIILKTCIKLMEHIKTLPVDKPENLMDTDCVTFNIGQHSGKQFRHYKYTIVTFLSGLLSSKQLVNLFAQLTMDDSLTLEPIYKNLIINILTYIQSVSKTVDRMSQTPQAQYWKVLIHHCYDTMDSVNALLTKEMFLLVIRGLIVHNIPTVRRKAMEILNTKLQYQQSFFYSNPEDGEITNTEDLFALIPSLINIVKTVENEQCGETEQELIQQTALLSLKLLIKLLANKNPDKFTTIMDFIIDLIKNKKTHGNILASVMLCLAELCSKLRAHAIPGLPRYMPAVIKILKLQQNQETPSLLLLCMVTAIQKIVESLPLFLSPYLEKLLTELTILSAKWDGKRSDAKVDTFVKKLDTIRSNIGTVIPSRILIPIITNTHSTLLENKQFCAIGPLMNVLAENLANLRGNELSEHLPELTNFFLSSLQFRVDCKTTLDIITMVEDHIIETLTALVLKLSETTFRPLYYKLFDWAVRGDSRSERVITFYRLSTGIAENLKGLFVLFAGHFIKNASELLESTNSIKCNTNLFFQTDEANHLLIESILTTLRAVFLYDSKNFMDKERFETLMQPLVDQLENQTGGIKCLMQRTEELVIPTIAQFAVAIADDALWKQLNYQVLLKTRHNHPQIRLIGLRCLCEVARKLGEDFLPLLPETIPFLAELLEDEDENVEKSCQKVVQDLEVILGEPLQKYF